VANGLTRAEAAKYLGFQSVEGVRHLQKAGKLDAKRDRKGHFCFDVADLDKVKSERLLEGLPQRLTKRELDVQREIDGVNAYYERLEAERAAESQLQEELRKQYKREVEAFRAANSFAKVYCEKSNPQDDLVASGSPVSDSVRSMIAAKSLPCVSRCFRQRLDYPYPQPLCEKPMESIVFVNIDTTQSRHCWRSSLTVSEMQAASRVKWDTTTCASRNCRCGVHEVSALGSCAVGVRGCIALGEGFLEDGIPRGEVVDVAAANCERSSAACVCLIVAQDPFGQVEPTDIETALQSLNARAAMSR
jgi:hypothetical protein